MDFLNGGELFWHLRNEMKFSEKRARFYAAEIIMAIEALHIHGVIYR
jgi:serine/threonine protein kinase